MLRQFAAFALTVLCGTLVGMSAFAEPVQLAAQGRLTALGGGPVADGNYAISIGIYAQAQGGAPLFEEPFLAMPVSGGVFSASIGAGKYPLDSQIFATGGPLWVSVTVGAEELTRVPLQKNPFAIHALVAKLADDLQCSGCIGTDELAAASITGDKIALGAVGANHVSFNWAMADSPGGAATFAVAANTAKLADQAKFADTTAFADEAAAAQKLQCTGCVATGQLADGAVTAAKLAPGALNWNALANVPAGFADGVDDTVSDAAIVQAVQNSPLNLAEGLQIGGAAAGRLATVNSDALADKGTLTLDTKTGKVGVLAQAWFYDAAGKSWLQANAGQSTAVVACQVCGSGKDGAYAPTVSTTLAAGNYEYTTFSIPKGVVVTVTGTGALNIAATGAIDIAGSLILDGGKGVDVGVTYGGGPFTGGAAGPGGAAGGTGYYGGAAENGQGTGGGIGAPTASYGGGGGGGSYGSKGQDGIAGLSATFGAAGVVYGDPLLGSFTGGSGGGAGGYGGAVNQGGSGGGGGGGAVKLVGASINVSGTISANGGDGGNLTTAGDGGAGGGGSGGAIWLRAAKIDMPGTVRALGGKGGSKLGNGGPGGNGGEGRIRIDSVVGATGVTTPAYGKGDTLGLNPPTTNTFSLDQPSPGVVRLTNLTGGVQKVQLVVTY